MKKYLLNIACLLVPALILVSCAEEKETDLTPFYSEMFDRWMAKYHPEAEKLEDNYAGLYVEWQDKNPGGMQLRDGYWMRLDYTGQDQNGDVIITRNRDLARQLGFFPKTARIHYVPEVIHYSTSEMSSYFALGQIIALNMMNEGDSLRVYMPPGLGYSSYSSYYGSTGYTYQSGKDYGFSSAGVVVPQNAGLIFDMRLVEVIKDINLYQREKVEQFAADSLGITDVADSIALGTYMKRLLVNEEGDSVKSNSKVKTFYVGRYLDGFVFDTNVEAIAEANDMPKVSGDPLEWDLAGSKLPVNGFKQALLHMLNGEHARVVMISDQAYGTTGNSDSSDNLIIPPYTPLEFEIWVESVETPEEEDDGEE